MKTVNTNVIEKMTTMISEKPVKNRLMTIKWKLVKLLSTISRDFHYNFGLNNNSLSLNIIISPELNIHGEGGTGDKSEEPEKAGNSRRRRRARRQLKHASDNSSSGYNSEKNEQQDENELQDDMTSEILVTPDKEKTKLSEEKANTDEEHVTSRQHIPVLESKYSLDARVGKEKKKGKSPVSPVVGFSVKNGKKNVNYEQSVERNVQGQKIEEKDDIITKAKDFLNKNNNAGAIDKDLHEEQWFYDHINMMVLEGPNRESVERLPGYHEYDAKMMRYRNKYEMNQYLVMEAKSVREKRKKQRAILEKMMKDYKEMEERMKEEKLKRKREREIEKIEEMKKREEERLEYWKLLTMGL